MGASIFAIGLLLGLDTLVAQAYGARRVRRMPSLAGARSRTQRSHDGANRGLFLLLGRGLEAWGLHASVLVLARPYVDILAWSVFPLLLYASFRRYLQGMGVVRPVMIALFTANGS
jgi:multidrug resistance protein, MATE family